ncbi:solute carrier family 2, facilitated glucose transporter member 1-like [Littorina saxatilis]|uniref:Major facilitator superfamily (MFS) profile domain-containing protein n=1 Tax=Littorina saxatilis TaxID=31220 RepID=A0AAN9AVA2_9CAEN
MGEEEQKTTGILLFSVFVAVIGNSFLYGYNIGVVNTPALIIQEFYNKTYYERNGGNWEDVVNYENYRKASETNTTQNYSSTNPASTPTILMPVGDNLQPEFFGVDKSKLLEKWQLEILWSVTVALFVFFGMIGAFSSAKVADFVGRKKGMIVITVIMFVAAILGGIPLAIKSPEVLMLSRVFVGLHSGLNISLCPLYLAEISPRKIRGAIGTCHQLAITIGILVAQIFGLNELLGTATLWPLLFAFNAVPSLMCLVLMPFCPESPRFLLIKKGQEEDARKVLQSLRGGDHNIEEEMEEMRVEARKSQGIKNFTIKELVTSPSLRLPVIIACLIQVVQQWSGINAVMSYSAFIFAQASVPILYIPYVIVGTGTINVLCTVIAVPLMEKLGRRPLLLWPMGVMCLSFLMLTIFLNLMGKPDLLTHKQTFAYVCIIAAHTYIIGFALGLGPIPFIVVSEIFRQEPRAAAMSLSLAFNWICNFILMLVFPFMKDGMGEYTYIVFSIILAAAIVFIFFFVPETKNKTFDEIANSIAFGRAKGPSQSYAFDDEAAPMGNSKV